MREYQSINQSIKVLYSFRERGQLYKNIKYAYPSSADLTNSYLILYPTILSVHQVNADVACFVVHYS